jgi:hypothetical protein
MGAFRAKRRFHAQLDAAALAIHHTMLEVSVQGAFVNIVLGRWHGPSSVFKLDHLRPSGAAADP